MIYLVIGKSGAQEPLPPHWNQGNSATALDVEYQQTDHLHQPNH